MSTGFDAAAHVEDRIAPPFLPALVGFCAIALLALGDAPGQYCLIEVKSPGDTLQDNQKRWLRYFADQGIPARVARVDWADD